MKTTSPTVKTISLKLIDEPVNVLRVAMDDAKMLELLRDIRDNGLYYPPIVRAVADRFEVVDGHRRLLACRELGLSAIPCIVQDDSSPPPEAVKLKSNLLREDNTDAEIAVWLGELVEKHGYNLEQLCAIVGRSESWVNTRTDLLRGDPDVLVALGEREISLAQAQVLNRCRSKQWRDLGLHYAITDHVPAARLSEWLTRNASIIVASVPDSVKLPDTVQSTPEQQPGIVCEFCGGFKDPHNMVQLWLHRWEWNIVQQILNQGQEQAGAAAVPSEQ